MKKNLLLYGSIGLLGICLSSIAFANSSLYSLKATNPANNNQLSAQNWDRLVSEVEKIQTSPASNKTQRDALLNEVQQLKLQVSNASSGSGIPAGAIMAFDLSTCPAGWTRYTAADNRFIMGAQSGFKGVGGNSQIMMQTDQLPDHSHFFTDIFFAENGHALKQGGVGVQSSGMFGKRNWDGSASTDADNDPVAVLRKTGGYILPSAGSHANSYLYDGYQTRDQHDADQNSQFRRAIAQQPLTILNPYIKLLYCKKN